MKFLISFFIITVMFLNTVEPDVTQDYMRYYNAQEEKVEPKEKCTCEKASKAGDISTRIGINSCVKITLYTKKNLNGVIFSEKYMSGFDPKKKSVLLIHGWASTGHEHYVRIAKTFATKKDMNAFVVGWHSLAYNCYFAAAAATNCIGGYIAKVLVEAVDYFGANPDDIHLIGHSLGAHVSGYAGQSFKEMRRKKLGRITGLDPAKPYFTLLTFLKALMKKDAEFVDVIHSCTDSVLGTDRKLGHIDVYVNGGSCYKHPHCKGKGVIGEPSCAHFIPVAMIEYTINNGPLSMKKCAQKQEPITDRCTGEDSKWSFEEPKEGTAGLFYLKLDKSAKLNGIN